MRVTKPSTASPRTTSTETNAPRQTYLKRSAEGAACLSTAAVPLKKQRITSRGRSRGDDPNPVNNLVDSLQPGLTLVMIGLNPGLKTAETGHAYAHRSNHFWPFLHESGITPRRHIPADTRALMDLYSIGNTNICSRPTRTGDGLSKQEMLEGAAILDEKVGRFRPETVAIVGKSIWETIFLAKTGKACRKEDFRYGWQDAALQLGRTVELNGTVAWAGARTYVTTTTSGLAAGMSREDKLAIWRPLGSWFAQRRLEREQVGDDGISVQDES